MGTTMCARCANMEKAGKNSGANAPAPEMDESDFEDIGSHDGSEVAASSDGDHHENEVREGVEDILKQTGKGLKRGKTMAMKEAINTAKKHNVEKTKIAEAERLLDDHKRKQWQEDVEQEVEKFFASPLVKDIPAAEKVVQKAKEAGCRFEVMDRVQNHLDMLVITRPLEVDEVENARDELQQACRDFVQAAVQGDGRKITILDLESGNKIPANLSLDPPLETMRLAKKVASDGEDTTMAVSSLNAFNAKDDKQIRNSKGFSTLDDGDQDCVVALRYQVDENGKQGVLCFVERDVYDRDRLREAVVVLMTICKK